MVTSASTTSFLLRRPTLKHEGPWLRAFHIAGFDGINLKPGCLDQVVHLTIEVTPPTDPLPIRRQTMLPASNPNFRRQTVLDEQQPPAWLSNPPHLDQRGDRIRDRAQRPGHNDGIEGRVGKRNMLRRSPDERHRNTRMGHPAPCQTQQFGRGVETNNPTHRWAI